MRIDTKPTRIATFRDIPEATIRQLVARGLSDQGMARELGVSATAVLKARKHYGIKTRCMESARPVNNRLADLPPPLSDAECHLLNEQVRAAEKRRPVWVPREANC